MRARTVIKYPGAKWRIADWIISKMPQHHSYLEPFFGSGAVLFNKKPSNIETINDIDNDVINLFEMVRDNADELARVISSTPFGRAEYENSFLANSQSKLEKARLLLVRCWQGHGYRTNGIKVGWKCDVQGRERAYAMRNWYRLPEWIIGTVERLKTVQIENRPALEVIKRFNYQNVCIYSDPPYVLATRTSKQYAHEMSDQDHCELLETLLQHKGTVMISGYNSDLYNSYLKDWDSYTTETTAEKGLARTEKLWIKGGAQMSLWG